MAQLLLEGRSESKLFFSSKPAQYPFMYIYQRKQCLFAERDKYIHIHPKD